MRKDAKEFKALVVLLEALAKQVALEHLGTSVLKENGVHLAQGH